MNAETRKKKLAEINDSNNAYMTGIRIRYKGESRSFNAYQIPLEYLTYNKMNGRIGSLVKSFEKQKYPLKAEKPDDSKVIESFLWDSKKARNETTELSLVEDKQKRHGIVTNDGIIIDGNRRAMILNRIYKNRAKWEDEGHNVDHARFFIGVILPEGADSREISRLETIYQMGEDEKLDYNPIEKYLKCKDLEEIHCFDSPDIAKMMGEKDTQIDEWLEIMDLMDTYLSYLGYDGIYTRLEKREGHFVDLNHYMKSYEKGSAKVDWKYSQLDLANLESVCFDYIRVLYEGKEFRNIAQISKSDSFFCKGETWQGFFKNYKDKIEPINEQEETVEEYRDNNKGVDLTKVLQARDNDWKKAVENDLVSNLKRAKRENELIKQANEPKKLVNNAIRALGKINTGASAFYDEEVATLLKKVSSIAYGLGKLIKKNRAK